MLKLSVNLVGFILYSFRIQHWQIYPFSIFMIRHNINQLDTSTTSISYGFLYFIQFYSIHFKTRNMQIVFINVLVKFAQSVFTTVVTFNELERLRILFKESLLGYKNANVLN